MKKNIKYNYVFLFYDVNEKRVNKIFKICKKYLSHFQNSVFRGEISASKLIKLKSEIKDTIEENDFISIIKVVNSNSFEEDIIGIKKENGEDLII